MPTKLIVPGLNGSGEGHWQDYWLQDDPDAILVEQSDWTKPDIAEWTARVEDAVVRHPGCILVAHSIGAIVVAGLATRPARHLVKGALLVAPCDPLRVNGLHPDVVELRDLPLDRLPFPSLLVASRNDPYMTFENAVLYAEQLGSDLIDLGSAGHINIASGYGRWKRGYRLAARLDRHEYVKVRDVPRASLLESLFGLRS
ncbi:alpha/beta hydrolase [Rhizobium sp. KVB221]|uniref:Alpha/beta hydrolase n=1 Tax=Rhizobium setariae TaxID=2801340 RepID=A0A936YU05_9HYPH|nr:alpha/beta hydrolase [Rhizobium setariae]MBL0372495.1 alpha/beta hydrolase [Rhizobium setariae]